MPPSPAPAHTANGSGPAAAPDTGGSPQAGQRGPDPSADEAAPPAPAAPAGQPPAASEDGRITHDDQAEQLAAWTTMREAEANYALRQAARREARDPGDGPAHGGEQGEAQSPAQEHRTGPGDPPGQDAQLLQELDDALAAIRQHRAARPDSTAAGEGAVRAALAALMTALEPGDQATASPPRPADPPSPPQAAAPDPADPDDLTEALAGLLAALAAPAAGRHAGPHRAELADPQIGTLLTSLARAAGEARAGAAWYSGEPEWQRITAAGRAARDLLQAVRTASASWWDEVRLDIRMRGFLRTVTARVSRAVAGAAGHLARRLERDGQPRSRPCRAAWGLHRAAAGIASYVIGYARPAGPAGTGHRPGAVLSGAGQGAAAAARASFPAPLTQALRQAGAGAAARPAARAPGRHAAPSRQHSPHVP